MNSLTNQIVISNLSLKPHYTSDETSVALNRKMCTLDSKDSGQGKCKSWWDQSRKSHKIFDNQSILWFYIYNVYITQNVFSKYKSLKQLELRPVNCNRSCNFRFSWLPQIKFSYGATENCVV